MYHGKRWINDPRFLAPMISSEVGQPYVGDFILFSGENRQQVARIKQFFCQVYCSSHNCSRYIAKFMPTLSVGGVCKSAAIAV